MNCNLARPFVVISGLIQSMLLEFYLKKLPFFIICSKFTKITGGIKTFSIVTCLLIEHIKQII